MQPGDSLYFAAKIGRPSLLRAADKLDGFHPEQASAFLTASPSGQSLSCSRYFLPSACRKQGHHEMAGADTHERLTASRSAARHSSRRLDALPSSPWVAGFRVCRACNRTGASRLSSTLTRPPAHSCVGARVSGILIAHAF